MPWCIVRKLKSKLSGNVSLITPRLWPLWEGTRGDSSASVALCGCTEGSVPGFKVKKLISVACAVWDLSGGRCDSGKLIKSYVVTVVAVKTRVADRNLSGSHCDWLALKLKSFFVVAITQGPTNMDRKRPMIVSWVSVWANNSLDSLIDYVYWVVCVSKNSKNRTDSFLAPQTFNDQIGNQAGRSSGFPLNLFILFSTKGPSESLIGVFIAEILASTSLLLNVMRM